MHHCEIGSFDFPFFQHLIEKCADKRVFSKKDGSCCISIKPVYMLHLSEFPFFLQVKGDGIGKCIALFRGIWMCIHTCRFIND